MHSLKILSFQVARFGLDKEVIQHLPPEDIQKNPFLEQNTIVQDLEKQLRRPEGNEIIKELCNQLREVVQHDFRSIEYIRQHHSDSGTSLHQTYTLVVLSNKPDRMNLLVDVIDTDQEFNTANFAFF